MATGAASVPLRKGNPPPKNVTRPRLWVGIDYKKRQEQGVFHTKNSWLEWMKWQDV